MDDPPIRFVPVLEGDGREWRDIVAAGVTEVEFTTAAATMPTMAEAVTMTSVWLPVADEPALQAATRVGAFGVVYPTATSDVACVARTARTVAESVRAASKLIGEAAHRRLRFRVHIDMDRDTIGDPRALAAVARMFVMQGTDEVSLTVPQAERKLAETVLDLLQPMIPADKLLLGFLDDSGPDDGLLAWLLERGVRGFTMRAGDGPRDGRIARFAQVAFSRRLRLC